MNPVFSQPEQQFLSVSAFIFTVFVVVSVLAYSVLVGRR